MADVSPGSGPGGGNVTTDATSGEYWFHISVPGDQLANDGVGGPVSGDGIVKFTSAGIHLYRSAAAAKAAPAQQVDKSQIEVILADSLAGGGIGHGFGLGHDVGQGTNDVTSATGLAEIGHYIGELVSHLTDVHMWISIGWIALGFFLLVLALAVLLRKPIEGVAALGAV